MLFRSVPCLGYCPHVEVAASKVFKLAHLGKILYGTYLHDLPFHLVWLNPTQRSLVGSSRYLLDTNILVHIVIVVFEYPVNVIGIDGLNIL